jgi:hypothetical protein
LCGLTFGVVGYAEVVFFAHQDAVSLCQDSASGPLFAKEAIPAVSSDDSACDESRFVMNTSLRIVQRG